MEIKKFRGLKNVTTAERFAAQGYLDAADNVDLDDTGKVLTRLATSPLNATPLHSLWADGDVCLAVDATTNDLYRVNADYSLTALRRLTAGRRASFNRQQGTVSFSNGVHTAPLVTGEPREWGIRPPLGQPIAAPDAGGLPPGRYQYALTFLRRDGQEGGTGVAGVIELTEQGGVAFSRIESSSDPEVDRKAIYLSGPNGEELFRALVLDNASASAAYRGTGADLGARLATQFDNPPPPGDIVECYNAVMYVVAGSVAWHSLPYRFERFCFRDQFLQFPGALTMFSAVNDGIYVSTADTTWFLSGEGPGKFKSKVVFDYGAIPGTAAKTTIGAIKAQEEDQEGAGSGTAVMWSTPRGVCFGTEGGVAINMTERDYALPAAARGYGLVRQARGYTQYLVALEGAETASGNSQA